MTYFNEFGQARLGWNVGTPSGGGITPSALWSSIYSVYNADSVGSSSLKTSLVSVYNGESNANDSYGSNNGTAMGGLTYTTGKIGQAFNFNGTTSYVSLPNSSNQFNLTNDFTISTWINIPDYTGYKMIFTNYNPGGTYGYGILMYLASNNIFSFELRSGSLIGQYQTIGGIPTNSWHHLVFVRKVGQNAKVYLNGVLLGGTYTLGNSSISPSFISGQVVNLGSISNGSNLVTYKQDATTIWNRELTASEVTELYNSGNGAQYITNDFYKPTTNDELNLRNGTPQGGLTYGVGKVGTAFQFNGSNAYVSYANDAFKFTGDFSINLWVNIASPTTNSVFIQNYFFQGGSGEAGYILEHTSAGNIRFYMLTTPSSSTQLNYNYVGKYSGWHMLTITKLSGSGACKMYVDGTLVLTNNSPGAIYYNSFNYSNIGVAKYVGGASGYVENGGKIDAVSLWNKELTATEITELYNSGNGKQYSN